MLDPRLSGFLFLVAATASAQTSAQPMKKPPPPLIRVRAISSLSTKPVLGLPDINSLTQGLCSSDGGDTYFNIHHPLSDASGFQTGADVYSVSTMGEVKHLRRKLPIDFDDIELLDFFPAQRQLVTLLVANKRSDDKKTEPPHERAYFLSLMDHDGAGIDLLRLDVKFKPLRVAQFGSGDFLVFGWETINNLPIMADVKPDGTVRRFVDFDDTRTAGLRSQDIQMSKMLPYGGDVLLEYPGTTKPVRIMRASGQDIVMPLAIPAGYVLGTVLVSTQGGGPFVARIVEKTDDNPRERLIEFSAPITEYTFERIKPENVTCAARSSLTALFMEDVGDAPVAADGTKPKRLVVGTVRR